MLATWTERRPWPVPGSWGHSKPSGRVPETSESARPFIWAVGPVQSVAPPAAGEWRPSALGVLQQVFHGIRSSVRDPCAAFISRHIRRRRPPTGTPVRMMHEAKPAPKSMDPAAARTVSGGFSCVNRFTVGVTPSRGPPTLGVSLGTGTTKRCASGQAPAGPADTAGPNASRHNVCRARVHRRVGEWRPAVEVLGFVVRDSAVTGSGHVRISVITGLI